MVLTHEQVEPIFLKFHLDSEKQLSSFVSRMYNYCSPGFENIIFVDDGSGQDENQGDGIYTATSPICYNRISPFPEDFELNRLRTTLTYTDGTTEKFMDHFGLKNLKELPQIKEFEMEENSIGGDDLDSDGEDTESFVINDEGQIEALNEEGQIDVTIEGDEAEVVSEEYEPEITNEESDAELVNEDFESEVVNEEDTIINDDDQSEVISEETEIVKTEEE